VACIWYAISIFSGKDGWVEAYIEPSASFGFSYLVSLHWALTQFSPATNNISPQTEEERAFACGVVIFALVVFSSFISNVTNAVNQLKTINLDATKEESKVRQFIGNHRISTDLGGRIQQFFTHATRTSAKRLMESDIKFFSIMPESMQMRMHQEMYMPTVIDNTMLRPFANLDEIAWIGICHKAVSELCCLPREELFTEAAPAEHAYVVLSGGLSYDSRFIIEQNVHVGGEEWFSEMALWAAWTHCGTMIGEDSSTIMAIHAGKFRQQVRHLGGALNQALHKLAIVLCAYAEVANEQCQNVCLPAEDCVTDLPLPEEVLRTESKRAYRVFAIQKGWASMLRTAESEPQRGGADHSIFSEGAMPRMSSEWRSLPSALPEGRKRLVNLGASLGLPLETESEERQSRRSGGRRSQ